MGDAKVAGGQGKGSAVHGLADRGDEQLHQHGVRAPAVEDDHGLDAREIVTVSEPKSISRETTFETDLHPVRDRERLSSVFTELCASMPAQTALTRYLQQGGYERHLRRLRGTLHARMTSASAVITATAAFGNDGPAATGSTVYGLSLTGGGSTLFKTSIAELRDDAAALDPHSPPR